MRPLLFLWHAMLQLAHAISQGHGPSRDLVHCSTNQDRERHYRKSTRMMELDCCAVQALPFNSRNASHVCVRDALGAPSLEATSSYTLLHITTQVVVDCAWRALFRALSKEGLPDML